MEPQRCLGIVEASQVGEARREATRLARAANLSETKTGEAAIIATELASNLVHYGTEGRLLLQVLHFAAGDCLEVVAVDAGPGIADLQRCLQDGYSTGGTPGTGLGAVRRISDEFDAYSQPGKGTVVMSRIHADGWTDDARGSYPVGAVSIPAPHEVVCGDGWCVAERPGELAVMVVDGLGHGPLAAAAAELAVTSFMDQPFTGSADFFARSHRALSGSRGAAVACAHVGGNGGLCYAGVGNIAGSLVEPDRRRGLPTQNGIVGVEMRKVPPPAEYVWAERGLLIMHSDGVTGRWSFDSYPGLIVRHPATVASVLWRDFCRGKDDATVVVIGGPAGREGR